MGMLSRIRLVIIGLGVFFAASCFAAETNAAPESFKTFVGGFTGPSYSVELRDGKLYYSVVDGPSHTRAAKITPSTQQWGEFRRALEDIGVWQWRTNYPNPRVSDGTQWSLEIRWGGRALRARGSNSFPATGGEPNGRPERTAK